MLPLEHFFVAFLPLLAFEVLWSRRLPTVRFAGVVFVGSQFPDLIDKPLAYQFGIIPSGRVLMHSFPTAVPFLLLVGLYGWKTNRNRLGFAFVFAHLSHLLADNYETLLGPDTRIPSDLLWPLAPPVARPDTPHWAGPGEINVLIWTAFSAVVLSVSVFLLVVDVREQFDIHPVEGS